MKIPLVDLHPVTSDCNITVSVGEAFDSGCSGHVTIIIINGKGHGNNMVLRKEVNNLTHETQKVQFENTLKIKGIYPVVATIFLDSEESKSDQTEYIKLCEE